MASALKGTQTGPYLYLPKARLVKLNFVKKSGYWL